MVLGLLIGWSIAAACVLLIAGIVILLPPAGDAIAALGFIAMAGALGAAAVGEARAHWRRRPRYVPAAHRLAPAPIAASPRPAATRRPSAPVSPNRAPAHSAVPGAKAAVQKQAALTEAKSQ